MTSSNGNRAYRLGVGVALATAFLTVWTTVVRDDGNGIGFFLLIMAAAVGWFAAWFQAAGMARTMLGVAVMQGLLGMLIATAPSTASYAASARATCSPILLSSFNTSIQVNPSGFTHSGLYTRLK